MALSADYFSRGDRRNFLQRSKWEAPFKPPSNEVRLVVGGEELVLSRGAGMLFQQAKLQDIFKDVVITPDTLWVDMDNLKTTKSAQENIDILLQCVGDDIKQMLLALQLLAQMHTEGFGENVDERIQGTLSSWISQAGKFDTVVGYIESKFGKQFRNMTAFRNVQAVVDAASHFPEVSDVDEGVVYLMNIGI